MFSGLLPKDLFKRKGSLAKSYFKKNYCHACHTRFDVFFPLPSCCVSSLIRIKRRHCSKSHILASDQPVVVLQALNQILQCTQGCEWYPWKPLDSKHPEEPLYLWGLQYVQTLLEIYTSEVCRKQNTLDLATTSKPNQRDGFLCRML